MKIESINSKMIANSETLPMLIVPGSHTSADEILSLLEALCLCALEDDEAGIGAYSASLAQRMQSGDPAPARIFLTPELH
jgi:hypothetical protein